jgi:hypothetical protein
MMLGNTPPGACAECGREHDPKQPHDQQSLTYQYKFYDMHGRWPTWSDAMAHCSDEIKALWRGALAERGIELDGPEDAGVEIEINIGIGIGIGK